MSFNAAGKISSHSSIRSTTVQQREQQGRVSDARVSSSYEKQNPETTRTFTRSFSSFTKGIRNFLQRQILRPKVAPMGQSKPDTSVLKGKVGVVMHNQGGKNVCLGFMIEDKGKQVFVSKEEASNPTKLKTSLSKDSIGKLTELSAFLTKGGDTEKIKESVDGTRRKIGSRLYIGDDSTVSKQNRFMGIRTGTTDIGKVMTLDDVVKITKQNLDNCTKANGDSEAIQDQMDSLFQISTEMMTLIESDLSGRADSTAMSECLKAKDELLSMQARTADFGAVIDSISDKTITELSSMVAEMSVDGYSSGQLNDQDISYLKTVANDVLQIKQMCQDSAPITDIIGAASRMVSENQTADGVIRSCTQNELAGMVRQTIVSHFESKLSDCSSLEQAASLIGDWSSVMSGLKESLSLTDVQLSDLHQTALDVVTNLADDKAIHSSASELGEVMATCQQLFKALDIPKHEIGFHMSKLNHANHFLTHFGGEANQAVFDAISPENKAAVLTLYQEISFSNKASETFLAKLGELCSSGGSDVVNSYVQGFAAEPSDLPMSKYQLLRLVSDTPLKDGTATRNAGKQSRFDDVILNLGKAAESLGHVPRGHIEVEHTLHSSLHRLSSELSNWSGMSVNSFSSLSFDKTTISAIQKHFNTDKTNLLLAHIVDLQDKISTGSSLNDPPSDTAMATIKESGLIPKGETEESFKAGIGRGVKSSKDLSVMMEKLSDFSKSLLSNADLQESLVHMFCKDVGDLAGRYASKFQASSLSEPSLSQSIKVVQSSLGVSVKSAIHSARGKEGPSVAKYIRKAGESAQKMAHLEARINTLQDDLKLAVKTGEPEFVTDLKSTVKTADPSITIETSHLQMAQNKSIIKQEIQSLETPSINYSKTDDPEVSQALSEKVKGSKDNAGLKGNLISGHVKLEGNVPTFYRLERQADGTVNETKVGVLSKSQAKSYLHSMKKSMGLSSSTVSQLLKHTPNAEDFSSPEMHQHLSKSSVTTISKELASCKAELATISSARGEALTNLSQVLTTNGLKKAEGKMRSAILEMVRPMLQNNVSLDECLESRELETVFSSVANEVGTEKLDSTALRDLFMFQVSELKEGGAETVISWLKDISMTSSTQKTWNASMQSQTFDSSLSLTTDIVSALNTDERICIDRSTLFSMTEVASASILAQSLISPITVAVDTSVSFEDSIQIKREQVTSKTGEKQDTFSVEMKQTKGASFAALFGMTGFLKANADIDLETMKGLRFDFKSADDTAGFLAALRTGNSKLALMYLKSVHTMDGKRLSLGASATVGFNLELPIDTGLDLFVGASVTVSGQKKTENHVQGHLKSKVETSSLSHGHALTVAGKAIDQRDISTERKVSSSVNTLTQSLDDYVVEDMMTFNLAGFSSMPEDAGMKIIESRLSDLGVDLSELASNSPETYAGVIEAFRSFNPDEESIILKRSLKADTLFEMSDPDLSEDEKASIMANPSSYDLSISIGSASSSKREFNMPLLTQSMSVTHNERQNFDFSFTERSAAAAA